MLDAVNFYYAWQMFRERCVSGHADPRFRKESMGPSGFIQASIVWRQWSSFCADKGVAWFNARESDVERYLQSIQTRRRPRVTGPDHKMCPTDRIKTNSRTTIRRYWRILNDFYTFGLAEHYVQHNPALEVKPEDGEGTQSTALTIAEYCQSMAMLPDGADVMSSRDRLVLLLVARHALTTAEIVGLRLSDVSELPRMYTGAAATGVTLKAVQHELPELFVLALGRGCATQARTIALDYMTSLAVRRWLSMRPKTSSTKLMLGPYGKDLTPKGVHILCSEHLEKSQISLRSRTGANTFRNSCILNWLNDRMPTQEIMRRCGFKDTNFFRRLACHIRPPIAEAYGRKPAFLSPVSLVGQNAVEAMEVLHDDPVPFKAITQSLAADGMLTQELSAAWDGTAAHAKQLILKLSDSGIQQSKAPVQ